MLLGAHISTSEGLANAPKTGREIGCDVIQIFSKSPQSWRGPPISPEAAQGFRDSVRSQKLRATAIHHCYLTNLASPKPAIFALSKEVFLDELRRAEQIGADAVIFHPGAHTGSGNEAGVKQIAEALRWAIGELPDGKSRILLENAAGQGTTVGSRFEELAQILETVGAPERVGITIDLCHLFASGMDYRTADGYAEVQRTIRDTIGTRAVRAFHLNDSKGELGSKLDRHENIGKGQIGLGGFRPWLLDKTWANVPGYLETPLTEDDYRAYVEDLAALRSLLPQRASGRKSS